MHANLNLVKLENGSENEITKVLKELLHRLSSEKRKISATLTDIKLLQ